jgi:hypothetical protein
MPIIYILGAEKRSIFPDPEIPSSRQQLLLHPKRATGHDPLYKLRSLLDPLIANFQASYTLHRELSIDEAMMGFKGRLFSYSTYPRSPPSGA